MLKRAIIALSVISLLICSFIPCLAAGPTISVGKIKASPGETITVPVSISGNPGINTFSLGFSYDRSKLTLKDVTISPKLGGQFTFKEKAVWLNSRDVFYNGEILYLKFLVADDAGSGETSVSVTYSPGDISNYNEDDVNFSVSSGAVEINSNARPTNIIVRIFRRIFEIIKRIFPFF